MVLRLACVVIAGAGGSQVIVADDCTILRGVKKFEYQVFDNGLP
ncbi:hypothetical protein WN982_39410 [Paraburkholderia sp. IMGN_8]